MKGAFADENDENIYSRFSNPNTDEFVEKMCALEGAEAGFATATGMAAVFSSIFALLKQAITSYAVVLCLGARSLLLLNTCRNTALKQPCCG